MTGPQRSAGGNGRLVCKKKSEWKLHLDAEWHQVWQAVTGPEPAWCTWLDHLEILEEGRRFLAVGRDGRTVECTVQLVKPCSLYRLELKGQHFTGSWQGAFAPVESGGTKAVWTAELSVPNPLRAAALPLERSLRQYGEDLRRYLASLPAPEGDFSREREERF